MIVVPLLVVLEVVSSSSGRSYADRLFHRRNGSDLCAFGLRTIFRLQNDVEKKAKKEERIARSLQSQKAGKWRSG